MILDYKHDPLHLEVFMFLLKHHSRHCILIMGVKIWISEFFFPDMTINTDKLFQNKRQQWEL